MISAITHISTSTGNTPGNIASLTNPGYQLSRTNINARIPLCTENGTENYQ